MKPTVCTCDGVEKWSSAIPKGYVRWAVPVASSSAFGGTSPRPDMTVNIQASKRRRPQRRAPVGGLTRVPAQGNQNQGHQADHRHRRSQAGGLGGQADQEAGHRPGSEL